VKKRSAKVQTDGQVLMDHIRELRTRLIVCAVVLLVGGVVGYFFYAPILEWLRSPLGHDLYYSTPAGSFNFIIKVASMVGILAAVPFIIFQLIMFIKPVFTDKLSTPRIFTYTIASILLAVTGALFAFYAILPGALKFFAGFQVAGLSALIDANNYLNFVTNAIVTFIIVFQIPLLMVIIDRIKPISPKKLLSMEKYVVLGGLLVSLIVPFAMDLTTCLLIASPIIILYNISVAIIIIRHAATRKVQVELPVVMTMTAQEAAMDDELVDEFFKSRPRELPALQLSPIEDSFNVAFEDLQEISVVPAFQTGTVLHRNISLPRDAKPLPGQMPNIEQLRVAAREKRDQEIAERVARYNTVGLKIINDIR
jgi:sec-independent protein translocase protein TatC